MSSNLRQVEITFDPLQDRLILKFFTQDLCEYQFWVTRRVVRPFWEGLIKLLQVDERAPMQKLADEKRVDQAFKSQQKTVKSSADKYATPVTKKPFGNEPMLVSRLTALPQEKGLAKISMMDEQGRKCELVADGMLILSLCRLLAASAEKAEWDINLILPGQEGY